ncbi:MAG: OsmC family protein [Elusimicrobiota bacterium]
MPDALNEKTVVHRYPVICSWDGSTAAGVEAYSRTHSLSARPAKQSLSASADPAFHGDPALLNPEQLLVMAASSCQMLSFLALAARASVDVIKYEDRTEGEMPEADRPIRISRIVLRPRITVRGTIDDEQLRRLVEKAHRICFIANSLKSGIEIIPEFIRAAG